MNSERHFELAVALSRDALKGLLLVNGGAATALIALMDKTAGSKNYIDAIIMFGLGTVAAVISACFGYFSQLNYANHRMECEQHQDGSNSYRKHNRWQTAAIITVLLTLIFMIIGILSAAYTASA